MFRHPILLMFMPFILAAFTPGCTEQGARSLRDSQEVVSPATYEELKEVFASHGYDWNTLDQGVPPLVLEKLPDDFNSISRLTEKKRAFFLSLLPMILMANEEIREKREMMDRLFRLHDSGVFLDSEQRAAVASLAREYDLDEDPLTSTSVRRELLHRVDIVPPSMALAQSATESGYGTSRFALEGNNLFGEWTFIPGMGLVPKERPEGEIYEVRRFDTLYDSVRSYMKNLNTHRAYRAFREQRAHLRTAGLPLQGMVLARNLKNYSSRKDAYVEDIRAIIRRNHLSILASANLRSPVSSPFSPASPEPGSGLLAALKRASRTQ